MNGLLIKSPWIEMILAGRKTWEIRGSKTKKRGQIALIRSGSGLIIGVCEIVGVIGPLSKGKMLENFSKHRIPPHNLKHGLPYEKTYAWVLKNVKPLKEPIPYKHPLGAVIWVILTSAIAKKIERVL